jgi:hypothetical protein
MMILEQLARREMRARKKTGGETASDERDDHHG